MSYANGREPGDVVEIFWESGGWARVLLKGKKRAVDLIDAMVAAADDKVSEADVQAQQELRAAMTGVPATGPYSLDAAQMAAAAQVAAAHTATLTVVKRMSAEERRYAKRRMEDVISRKKVAFKQERDASDKYQERRRIFAEEIAKGHFTINQAALVKATYDTDLRDVVMLHSYPAGLEAYTRSQYAAFDARQATMEREGARIIDEIMLGSPADAIVQIQRFESTKF